MTEVEKIAAETLLDMDSMTIEEIEMLRKEWFEQQKQRAQPLGENVDRYVNALCDTAINRAKKRQNVA